ncbi:TetR/AcrR family transcriptional regulator [Enterococcus gilvus]|uniref:TetR/AcrR family transcriptional regulator n=1 Tax=Enterococcus gilvus TaxID=160453 RepID=UPI00345E9F24
MPSKPVLRMEEKQRIKQQLLRLCEEAWIDQGYKKTSIKYLCTEAGISIGTCYALFSTKEKIFLATAQRIQSRLMERFKETVSQQPNQKGVSTALKELAREFDRAPFLYDVSTPDFRAFVTKLSVEEMRSIKFESIAFFRNVCQMANLEPVIDNETAFGVLSTLLSTISTKKTLEPVCDFFTVFDFMTDRLIAELFADKVSERSS